MIHLLMNGRWSPLPRASLRLSKPSRPEHGSVYRVGIPVEDLEIELRVDGQVSFRQVEAETWFADDRQALWPLAGKSRSLLAGNPFAGVKDLVVDALDWNGLTARDVLRLKAACEQRVKACTRKDQNPLLEAAVFFVLLHTGLRESELVSLDLEQYHERGFHQVPRKGKRVSKKVPVPADAREWLDRYLIDGKLQGEGPLFLSRRGKRLAVQDVARICGRICRQANAHVPEEEKLHLIPHMLRHTFLKRVADKHGVHVAQQMSGNISIREVFRYTKPSETEMARTAEELFS
jgi:integrase/recombinase XerD